MRTIINPVRLGCVAVLLAGLAQAAVALTTPEPVATPPHVVIPVAEPPAVQPASAPARQRHGHHRARPASATAP